MSRYYEDNKKYMLTFFDSLLSKIDWLYKKLNRLLLKWRYVLLQKDKDGKHFNKIIYKTLDDAIKDRDSDVKLWKKRYFQY